MTRYAVHITNQKGRPFVTPAKNHKHAARVYLAHSPAAIDLDLKNSGAAVLRVKLIGNDCHLFYRCRGGSLTQVMRHRHDV